MNLNTFLKNPDSEKLRDNAVQYLLSEGDNKKLAKRIKESQCKTIELIEYPLEDLKCIVGPDPKMLYYEDSDTWENRVTKLVTAIKDGYEPLPLFATDFWGEICLADGNHRYEALIRSGFDKYWTVFFLKQ